MAEKVTSWFVPQNILDAVSPTEAQAAASQARNTFIMGLLGSGDFGAAYNNAANQGYNTLAHGVSLAESKRKADEDRQFKNLIGSAIQVAPGTGYTLPEGVSGPQIPPKYEFNYQAIKDSPLAPFFASKLKPLADIYGPNLDSTRGMIYDKNDPRNVGRYIPELPQGVVPVGVDPKTGQTVYANAPGVVNAIGQQKGAEATATEGAKANFDLVDVTMPDGSKVKVPRMAVLRQSATGQPMVAQPSPAMEANLQGYKPILDDAYKGYTVANSRAPTLQRLSMLAEKLDTNSFTGAKATIQGYLNAMGVTGDDAKRFLTDVSSFRQGLNDLAAANFKDMTGAISNFDVDFTLKRQPQLTDVRESNQFNLAVMQAQDERKREFYRFVQKNPTPDVILRWEESEKGRQSIYESPKLRKYLPQQVVQSGPHKGKTAYVLPDGTAKVFD